MKTLYEDRTDELIMVQFPLMNVNSFHKVILNGLAEIWVFSEFISRRFLR